MMRGGHGAFWFGTEDMERFDIQHGYVLWLGLNPNFAIRRNF
jgi:hypothetical protein